MTTRGRATIMMLAFSLSAGLWARGNDAPLARVQQALDEYDAGIATIRNPVQSEAHFAQARDLFASLVDDGVRNAAIEFNLGNAEFRLGRLGQAIAHYRAAIALDPGNEAIGANLSYARDRVEPRIPLSDERATARRLTAWMPPLSSASRWWVVLLAGSAGWGLLGLRLRLGAKAVLVPAVIGIGASLLVGVPLVSELRSQSARPDAVLIDGEHTLRLGRGDEHEPALRQALGAGVEVQILQERAGWIEVALADDRTGWLAEHAVVRIDNTHSAN